MGGEEIAGEMRLGGSGEGVGFPEPPDATHLRTGSAGGAETPLADHYPTAPIPNPFREISSRRRSGLPP